MKKISEYGIEMLEKIHKTTDGVMTGDPTSMKGALRVASLGNSNARNINAALNCVRLETINSRRKKP